MTTIDTAFAGGNLLVEGFDGTTLTARPDLRDTTEPWFWWCFRVRDPGERLAVRFTRPHVLGPLGPACSLDDGQTWSWLGAEVCTGDGFDWTPPPGCSSARFAMAMPYLLADWLAFAQSRPWLRSSPLCLSRRGRSVPMALVGADDAPDRVLLTARHHACESTASWVLEGFLDAWRTTAAADRTQLFVVPLVDLDGVEDGDQGKARAPHDHNRDYRPDSIHPETTAIQQRVPAWADGRLRLGLDLHSPWLRHAWNEHVYAVGHPDALHAARQQALMDAWHDTHRGMLPIGPHRIIPFGTAWNVRSSGWTCHDFVDRLGGLGLGIETPYAGMRRDGLADLDDPAALVANTPAALRDLGASLTRATAAWLAGDTV
jgi:hypothetical protein